ncbi:MAG: hypothetical protein COA88_14575 [Kordia sp.]|nr:MAG: hypothetical protein COA88_14575 [Kordia sp.]
MKSNYYTPNIEEFHVGFEYEQNWPDTFNGIEDVHNHGLKKSDVREPLSKRSSHRYERDNWSSLCFDGDYYLPSEEDLSMIRVKCLDEEGIEDYLNKVEQKTGKKWKRGRQAVKGDAPATSPWIEFIFEDASSMIFNEYLQKVLVEKTGTHGRGSHIVFNGAVKNKSELKRILKQVGI